MNFYRKKSLIYYLILFLLLILFYYFVINKFQEDKVKTEILEPISINLLTSVHPNLLWSFKPTEPNFFLKPGEVKPIEYIVENLGNQQSTGIATFAYFPNQFGNYINKINCFCYDAQTLKPKEKDKFTLVLMIDPEVTKDGKTKDVKEVTIQFTFFDYKEYKKNKN